MISFSVPSVPVAQPRQRHRVVTAGGRTFAQNYTPKNDPVNTFKAAIQKAATEAYPGPPMEGPLAIRMTLLFPRPGRLIWKTKPMPRLPHDIRPDAENCAKAVLDALTGLIYMDDSQVSDLTIKKRYASGDEQAGAHLEIEQLKICATGEGLFETAGS